MKQWIYSGNVFLLALLLAVNLVYAQGIKAGKGNIDLIVMIENPTSADLGDADWPSYTAAIQSIASQFLQCDQGNRVAVVQFAATGFTENTSTLYIESDFTNTVGGTIPRRSALLGQKQFVHGAVGLLGDALDGKSNPQILSPLTKLNTLSGQKLTVLLVTQADKNNVTTSVASALINKSDWGWQYYN